MSAPGRSAASPDAELAEELLAVGRAAGLDRLGIAPAAPFVDARRILEERRDAGLAGSMQFTYRNPARSTDPARTVPGARSLIVAARRYPPPPDPDAATRGARPTARVAAYVVGDHYGALRTGLEAMATVLRREGWTARVLADDNALVDRAAARRAGLGWFGKNANLLVPGAGSWFVLGSVVTDAVLPPTAVPESLDDGCGTCSRCVEGCPTAAIVGPGVVDARRCLAWLLQATGPFPAEHRVALGDRLYGCDECQQVCPPNRRADREGVVHRGDRDEGTPVGDPADRVDVLDVLAATDDELLARFGRWYIPRREARYLRRNALVVLGNTAEVPPGPPVVAALVRSLADPDPLVRGHAVWAARRLGREDLTRVCIGDPDSDVRAELAADVPARAGSTVPVGEVRAAGAPAS